MTAACGARVAGRAAIGNMALQRPDAKHLISHPAAAPTAAFLLTVLVQLPFFRLWFNFMDEGHMVQFADIVVRGGEFYRDATFYPLPGAFWLLAGVFEVFGASILVSRWLVMLQFALFTALVFVLMRRLTDTRWAILAVGCMWLYRVWCFPHWQIYNYSTTSLLVLLACLLTLLAYLRSGSPRVLLASGLLYGLGVLCKQDYGAAALVTALVLFSVHAASVPRSARPAFPMLLAGFFGPAALVGALTGLYFWQAGILPDLIRFTVTNHFVGMGTYEYMEFPSLGRIFGQDAAMRTKIAIMGYMPGIMFTADWANVRSHPLFTGTSLYDLLTKAFFFLPQVLLAGAFVRLFLVRGQLAAGETARLRYLHELALVTLGATLITLAWLNKPQDYLHLAVLYWPLICLVLVHLHALLAGRPRRLRIAAAAAALPALLLVAYSGRLLVTLYTTHTHLVPGDRAGIYAQPTEARMLGDLIEYMQANSGPEDTVAAIPYFPIANFLAERMGPHRSSYIVWPFPEMPDRDEQIVAAMEERGTDLVIYNFTQFYSFNPVWAHAPVLFEYLVDNFEIDRVFTYDAWGYKLVGLKRRKDERRGQRIVPPGAVGASLRVEEDGPPRPVPPESRSALRTGDGSGRSARSSPCGRRPAGAGRCSRGAGRCARDRRAHPQSPWRCIPSGGSSCRRRGWSSGSRSRARPAGRSSSSAASTRRPCSRIGTGSRSTCPSTPTRARPWRSSSSTAPSGARGETVWMGGWAIPRLEAGPGFEEPAPSG